LLVIVAGQRCRDQDGPRYMYTYVVHTGICMHISISAIVHVEPPRLKMPVSAVGGPTYALAQCLLEE
jgi:hypothetical protein